MSKFLVKIGDETQQVDFDAITAPEGFVLMPQSQFDSVLTDRVRREKRGWEASLGDPVADDEVFKKAAARRGIELDTALKPVAKLDPEKVEQMRTQFDNEVGKPLREELTKYKALAEKGRKERLYAAIQRAAPEAGVKKDRLKSLFGGEVPEFVEKVASLFEYDEERDTHFFKDPAGNPVYADKPVPGGSPYAGPDRLLDHLRKQDADFIYFEDKRPGNSGLNPGGGETRPGVVSRDALSRGEVDLEAVASGKVRVQ